MSAAANAAMSSTHSESYGEGQGFGDSHHGYRQAESSMAEKQDRETAGPGLATHHGYDSDDGSNGPN